MPKPIAWIGLLLLLYACNHTPPPAGFYYWKSRFSLDPVEKAFMDSLNAQSIYIRIFDVDLNSEGRPVPKGTQTDNPPIPQDLEAVPVIFITNRTLKNLSPASADSLARKMTRYTEDILAGWPHHPRKIQIDADWTLSTKDNYFALLRLLKKYGHFEKLSVTVRLHQFKYPDKTGVPPADEGILMCYNTGNIHDPKEKNSIATPEAVSKYFRKNQKYPLPLGLALPVFGWTVIYRDSTLLKIVADPDLSWQQDTSRFQKITPNNFIVKKNTFFHSHYLYEGDLLRTERVSPEELTQIARIIAKSNFRFREILFYHLDKKQLQYSEPQNLKEIIQILTPGHQDR